MIMGKGLNTLFGFAALALPATLTYHHFQSPTGQEKLAGVIAELEAQQRAKIQKRHEDFLVREFNYQQERAVTKLDQVGAVMSMCDDEESLKAYEEAQKIAPNEERVRIMAFIKARIERTKILDSED